MERLSYPNHTRHAIEGNSAPPAQRRDLKRFFTSQDATFVPSYKAKDFLDLDGLKSELDYIGDEIDRLNNSTMVQFQTTKQQRQMRELQEKESDIIDFIAGIEPEFDRIKAGEYSIMQASLNSLMLGGSCLLFDENLAAQENITRKSSSSGTTSPSTELLRFVVAGGLDIKIADASLRDLLKKQQDPEHNARMLSFFVESCRVRWEISHDAVATENQGKIQQKFPNNTKNNIEWATGIAGVLISIPKKTVDDHGLRLKGLAQESLQKGNNLVTATESFQESICAAILDPTSPSFPSLKDAISFYMNESDEKIAVTLLQVLTRGNYTKIPNLYRKAKDLTRAKDGHAEFYKNFSDLIREFADAIPYTTTIHTEDDLYEVFDAHKDNSKQNVYPSFEDLEKTIGAIFSKSSTRAFDIDPNKIDWAGIVPPRRVKIEFEQRPSSFKVYLKYQNLAGESTTIEYDFDVKKKIFDWSFIETPDENEQMQLYCDAANSATGELLNHVKQTTEDEYRRKQQQKKVRYKITPVQQVKTVKPEYVPSEKPEKDKPVKKVLSPIQRALLERSEKESQPAVTTYIALPEDEELVRMIASLATVDRQEVIGSVREFNERGIGTFKKLKALGPDGQALYSLRVSGSVRGGIRVLLEENEPIGSKRVFSPIDIGYRKDIYRRQGV